MNSLLIPYLFDDEMIGDKELKPNAKLDIETYALRTPSGEFDLEEVQINEVLHSPCR